jgi:MFS family permease
MSIGHSGFGRSNIRDQGTAGNEEVGSDIEAKSDISEPPDGGYGWVVVAAAFVAFANSWGVVNTFGAFQQYYHDELLLGTSQSTIDWIGSVQAFFTIFGGIYGGRLVDAGWEKPVLVVGAILGPLGMMMTSLSTEFYQIFLSQGVCTGMGASLLFLGAVTVAPQYFKKRRSFALGVCASGSSFGAVVYPIMVHRLLTSIGFAWTARALGFVLLAGNLFPVLIIKARIPPRRGGPLLELGAFKEPAYTLFVAAGFFGFMGVYTAIFFLQSYAVQNGIGSELAFYFTSILNAGSVFGRLVPNYLADKMGPINVIFPYIGICGILAFCWIRINTEAGLLVFAILYGYFSGAFVSLPPAVIASLTKDMSRLGTRMGMFFFISSIGVLVGTPISGALITSAGGSYVTAQVYSGVLLLASFAFAAASRFAVTGFKLMAKA